MRRLLAVSVSLAMLLLVTAAPAGATPPRWQLVKANAAAKGVDLVSVACPARNNCVAVGSKDNAHGYRAVAMRWNGTGWKRINPVLPGEYNLLTDVVCPAPNDCWATGSWKNFLDDFAPQRLWIGHWNGKRWITHRLPAAATPDASNSFQSATCLSRSACIFTGLQTVYDQSEAIDSMLVYRWNGSSLTSVRVGVFPSASFDLTNVSCPSLTNCWATGQSIDSGRVVLYRWTGGRSWTKTLVPSGFGAGEVTALACPSATNCLIAAYTNTNPAQAYVLHYLNGRWTRFVDPKKDSSYNGIGCRRATDCYAVGNAGSYPQNVIVTHFDGGRSVSESAADVPGPSYDQDYRVMDVACWSATGCIAVGTSGITEVRH